MPGSCEAVVRLRGLPFGCSKEEIAQFFTGEIMVYLFAEIFRMFMFYLCLMQKQNQYNKERKCK